jgi:hypothetical protein
MWSSVIRQSYNVSVQTTPSTIRELMSSAGKWEFCLRMSGSSGKDCQQYSGNQLPYFFHTTKTSSALKIEVVFSTETFVIMY